LHKQRKTISDLEVYSDHKASALKTLSDFFNNKTLKAVKPSARGGESKRKKSKDFEEPLDFGNDIMPEDTDE
jgi:hypothetical protein